VISPDVSKHEAGLLKLDINKAIALLGWKPALNFKETLDLTFMWYKNYYEKNEDVVEFTNKQINSFLNNTP
jgi:CDP-glucose 4,6-dehydratase